jgi:hypothetical protein
MDRPFISIFDRPAARARERNRRCDQVDFPFSFTLTGLCFLPALFVMLKPDLLLPFFIGALNLTMTSSCEPPDSA